MRIALIGIGNVGSALGRRWAEAGHEMIVFGVRDTTKPKNLAEAKAINARLASIADAVAEAEIVVLAVPWKAVPDALAAAGDLSGKVLLDCTNPLAPDLGSLVVSGSTSGGEQIAQRAPGARVVKIFNTTGSANMVNPRYGETPITMFYAGDDPGAKDLAAQLARDIGFEPVDAGPLSAARLLEPLALLWISLASRHEMGPDFALTLVRRPAG
jgi:predicted dinucleotide-binding enzyme